MSPLSAYHSLVKFTPIVEFAVETHMVWSRSTHKRDAAKVCARFPTSKDPTAKTFFRVISTAIQQVIGNRSNPSLLEMEVLVGKGIALFA